MEPGIIREGRNCWKIAAAAKAAFLIDGESYFRAFYDSVSKARKAVYILAWDFDSRVRLLRNDSKGKYPAELGSFLGRVARKRKPDIYVLVWDPALIYRFERQVFPGRKLIGKSRRIRFHLDSSHPFGVSSHQKIVVIDDSVAFCGGIDLSKERWDTRDHLPGDGRRRNPAGEEYPPFHDIQMAVSGDAAARLGELARSRWEKATGQQLEPPSPGSDPWPDGLVPDLENVRVAIARTYPAYRDYPEIREVESLYLDSINAARRFIYLENQYFTSFQIGKALARRLEEKNGPEVVLVLPLHCSGRLEESTMGVLRLNLLRDLRKSDRHRRLRVFYPVSDEGEPIMVHSKTMVVDDRLLRIGSSNTTSRSLGTDIECDLALEADSEKTGRAVAGFRNRLLAEHLGIESKKIAQALARTGSLIETIELFHGGRRELLKLKPEEMSPFDQYLAPKEMADPERPISGEEYLERYLSPSKGKERRTGWFKLVVIGALILGATAFWHLTGAEDWVRATLIEEFFLSLRDSVWAPMAVVSVFVIGGLVMLPVTWMIVGTALIYGPVRGFVYSLAGTLLSASAAYLAGKIAQNITDRHTAGRNLSRVRKWLSRTSIPTIAVIRNIPIVPFTVVNMMAGSMRVSFRVFILGTIIGMLPGMAALVFFSARVVDLVRDPSLVNVLIAGATLAVMIALATFLQRRLNRVVEDDNSEEAKSE